MFDPVPWLIGGGAQHSPEVARLLGYAALGGAEGTVGPGDLKVTARDVPGAGVSIVPGACSILNRSSGGDQQVYIGRNPTADPVDIAATGSASGRSDLIVVRVEDPSAAGVPWQAPTDPKVGPYIFARVIPNVPASTVTAAQLGLGHSMIALARVDIPASTAAITGGMITDLREVVASRKKRDVYMGGPTPERQLTSTTGERWPDFRPSVKVPTWATHVKIIATLTSIGHQTANTYGTLTATLGESGPSQFRSAAINYDLDLLPFAGARTTLIVAGAGRVPAALLGTVQSLGVEGTRADHFPEWGVLITKPGTQVIFDVEFSEERI